VADPRVNLKITADASQARRAGRDIEAAFNPRAIKAYKAAGKDLEAQFVALARRQVDLTRALLGVEKGSKAYKDLRKELRGAADDARLLQTALRGVEAITGRQEQSARQAAQQRRRSFFGGLMQGAGVAQYMPAGPGMGARTAGALLGGGVRRMGGMATSPFLMPGMGGLSQAASMIPIVGAGISGALSTAAGAYQSAVGYDRARLENLPHAGAVQSRRWIPKKGLSLKDMPSPEESQMARDFKSGMYDETMAREPGKFIGKPKEHGAVWDARAGKWGPPPVTIQEAEAATWRKRTPEEARAAAAETHPAAAAAAAKYDKWKAAQGDKSKGRWEAFTETGPGMEAGARYGLGPTQMQAAYGQFMGARGGIWDPTSKPQFMESMAAKARFGIDPGTAGRFARAGIAGGGGRGIEAAQGLSGTLQAAFRAGLEGSQIAEYLQTLVQLTEQAERSGVKIDVREFNRMAGGLTGIGIEGLQAQRIAGGLTQAGMGLAERGVSKPADMIMLRAAGFRPEQGAEGYAKAMRKLEGGLDVDMMQNLLATSAEGVKAGGFGPEMQSLLLKRLMGGGFGVKIGMEQADRLIAAGGMGAEGLSAEMARQFGKGERPGARGRMMAEAEGAVAKGAPLTRGAAGLEAAQIAAGQAAAAFVPAFERAQLKAATVISTQFGKHLGDLAKLVEGGIGKFDVLLTYLKTRLNSPGSP
jgi:hypothetical protein